MKRTGSLAFVSGRLAIETEGATGAESSRTIAGADPRKRLLPENPCRHSLRGYMMIDKYRIGASINSSGPWRAAESNSSASPGSIR